MLFTLKLKEPFAPGCEFTKLGPVGELGAKVTAVIGWITPFKETVTFCDAGVACPTVVSVNEIWLGGAISPLPLPELLPIASETLRMPLRALPFAVITTVP